MDAAHEASPPCSCAVTEPECASAVCTDSGCSYTYTADNTPLSSARQTAGDCAVLVCDGTGGVRTLQAADPPPNPSECIEYYCDGLTAAQRPLPKGTPCSTGVCSNGTCLASLCLSGELDGTETDIDCGGASCPSCPDGAKCIVASDCNSLVCTSGTCQVPSCTDGVSIITGYEICDPGVDGGSACTSTCRQDLWAVAAGDPGQQAQNQTVTAAHPAGGRSGMGREWQLYDRSRRRSAGPDRFHRLDRFPLGHSRAPNVGASLR